MPHPVKKIYAEDSPGGRRKVAGLTLSQIKRDLAASDNKTALRRKLHADGLLG